MKTIFINVHLDVAEFFIYLFYDADEENSGVSALYVVIRTEPHFFKE